MRPLLSRLGPWPLAAALFALSWGVTFLVRPWSDISLNDLGVYRRYAVAFWEGSLPYRDFFFEYPPLAAPVMALAGVAGVDHDAYRAGFAVLIVACAAALVVLTGRLAALTGGDRRLALAAAAAAPLLTGAVARTHFDLVPVLLTVAALAAIVRDRPALGFGLLGAGTMTKLFPLVVAPVALAWLVARGERRAALRGVATLALTVLALGTVAVALSPAGALDAVEFHVDRPVLSESSPASLLFGLEAAGGGQTRDAPGFRSHGIEHDAGDAVLVAFAALMLLAVGALAALAAASARPRDLVLAGLAAVAAFAAFGKVLSPQFLVWAVPLFALALAWRMWTLAAASGAAMALTLVFFPAHYDELVAHESFPIALLSARNLALIAAVCLALRALRRARLAPTAPLSREPSTARGGAGSW